jgi:hypothetical protein
VRTGGDCKAWTRRRRREGGSPQRFGESLRLRLIQAYELIIVLDDQGATAVEIAALCHATLADASQSGWKKRGFGLGSRVQDCVQIPIRRTSEGDAFALSINDQPGRDRLYASGRQSWHDLLPQHGRDLVAVETIKNAPGLLGIDQVLVKIAWVGDRLGNGRGSDLMEDHAFGRDLRLQLLQQVPRDRLAFTIAVSRE